MTDWIGVDVRKATCSIEGCTNVTVIVRQMCTLHYARWRATGTTEARRTAIETFWDRVDKSGDCWIWTSTIDAHGYGSITAKVNGKFKALKAHRVAWESKNGPIADGLLILHSCDNPPCVNPAHLRPGTAQENINDMIGRGRGAKGPDRPQTVLDEDQVRQIRRLRSAGMQIKEIAAIHKRPVTTIHAVVQRRTWAWVEDAA